MAQTNQTYERKLVIPDTSGLVKKQIMMLKLVKQKIEYLVLVVWLRILH